MKILFDQGTPAPLRHVLAGHTVVTASEMAWSTLDNGDLLKAAESSFDVLITTDKNLRYQQVVTGRQLSIVVLPTTSWPRLQRCIPDIVKAVDTLTPGDFVELRLAP
jgi:predicted nuclease of predicted toxin-antitoxin system